MKINTLFNELPKKYSFNCLAYFGYLLILEFLLYFSLSPLILIHHGGYDCLSLMFALPVFLSTIFFFLMLIKVIIFIKIRLKELKNINFKITSNRFNNNFLYKCFIFLSFLLSLMIYSLVIIITFLSVNKAFMPLHISHFYPMMFFFILFYLLISNKYNSLKIDFCFYILYLFLSLILVILMILRIFVF